MYWEGDLSSQLVVRYLERKLQACPISEQTGTLESVQLHAWPTPVTPAPHWICISLRTLSDKWMDTPISDTPRPAHLRLLGRPTSHFQAGSPQTPSQTPRPAHVTLQGRPTSDFQAGPSQTFRPAHLTLSGRPTSDSISDSQAGPCHTPRPAHLTLPGRPISDSILDSQAGPCHTPRPAHLRLPVRPISNSQASLPHTPRPAHLRLHLTLQGRPTSDSISDSQAGLLQRHGY